MKYVPNQTYLGYFQLSQIISGPVRLTRKNQITIKNENISIINKNILEVFENIFILIRVLLNTLDADYASGKFPTCNFGEIRHSTITHSWNEFASINLVVGSSSNNENRCSFSGFKRI